MNKKFKILISFMMFFLMCGIFNMTISNAESKEVVDVVLFWGQSNMVGYAGRSSAENVKDERNGAFKDILPEIKDNATTIGHVNVQLKPGSAYEYLYSTNSLKEITADTEKLGENLTASMKDGKLEIKERTTNTQTLSAQQSYGTNMIPQFCKTYNEKTGRKVIVVFVAKGGQEIANFLPREELIENSSSYKKDNTKADCYIYETMKEKYLAAINYLNEQGYSVGRKLYVAFQGESDRAYATKDDNYATKYYNRFLSIHNHLKTDLKIDFGAVVYNGGTYKEGNKYDEGLKRIYQAQKKLVVEEKDIVKGSLFAKKNYKDESKMCLEGNEIHFTSAALSQIGYETANNICNNVIEKTLQIKMTNRAPRINFTTTDGKLAFYLKEAGNTKSVLVKTGKEELIKKTYNTSDPKIKLTISKGLPEVGSKKKYYIKTNDKDTVASEIVTIKRNSNSKYSINRGPLIQKIYPLGSKVYVMISDGSGVKSIATSQDGKEYKNQKIKEFEYADGKKSNIVEIELDKNDFRKEGNDWSIYIKATDGSSVSSVRKEKIVLSM